MQPAKVRSQSTPHPSRTSKLTTYPDVPTILALITELAAHQEAADSVLATEASLLDTLSFAPQPNSPPSGPGYAKALLLRLNSKPIGMALYFNSYSTWRGAPGIYLEDLYVKEEYRGRGYGKLLIKALAKETKRIGGGRLEWSCLKWNEKSLRFYEALGAVQQGEWVKLRCDGEVLDRLAAADGPDHAK